MDSNSNHFIKLCVYLEIKFYKMKLKNLSIFFSLCVLTISTLAQDDYKIKTQQDVKEYTGGAVYKVRQFAEPSEKTIPKNVIFLIGDGMGLSQIFSGLVANRGDLFLKNFTNIGFSSTQSASHFITDSGAGGTALATGKKTFNGAIGVDTDSLPLQNIREKAEAKGLATGVVSTSAITHATPASFIAHQPNRDWYEEIASDFLKTNIDVFIGGGLKNFTTRKDSANLLIEFQNKGYQVLTGIDSISKVTKGKLAGFTSTGHNITMLEGRGDVLPTATKTAIEILDNDSDGFFLMVEGSQIDWGCHQNNTDYIVTEMMDFDQAIGVALEFASKNNETLVIVTADHETSGFSIEGGNLKTGEVIGDFTSEFHTGVMVPVFAFGPGSQYFRGFHDNTDIPKLISKLAGY
jgi:alkaline phosphatase